MPRDGDGVRHVRGCWRATPRSGRAGSRRRRSRRPPASRRSRARGPCGRCRARRRSPGSPAGRSGRPAGWWSRCRTARRRSATSGLPGVELFELGQERPVPERRQTGVGQVELLRHARRESRAADVVVLDGPWTDSTAVRRPLTRERQSKRRAARRESAAWPSPRSTPRRRRCGPHGQLARRHRRRLRRHIESDSVKLVDPIRLARPR